MSRTIVQYELCVSCGKQAMVCPTTTFPEGIICTACLLKDRPCEPALPMPVGYPFPDLWRHMPKGRGFHNPSCPESRDYDRRKTRTNMVECPRKTEEADNE